MSAPILQTLRRDLEQSRRFKWRIEIRDNARGRVFPVMVEAGPEYEAVTKARNQLARFLPAGNCSVVSARRVLG
ncbi:MAG: hypothetical protein H3C27_08635 [Opitutaceae bacterium]|nr:hypothetical protein [Opitutaceae bacterium]